MELNIVNPDPRYSPVNLIEPTTLGYIHLAAEVTPRPMPPQRLPFVPNRREKEEKVETHLAQLDYKDNWSEQRICSAS